MIHRRIWLAVVAATARPSTYNYVALCRWQPFNAGVQIVPMTMAYAADIATWRYAAPYDCYDMADSAPAFLADPASGFFALVGESGLIGFRAFGVDGQVPGGEYDDSALDTGGGLRPELTGQGMGRKAIRTGLEFGRKTFRPSAFRVTVATFNVRARRVIAAHGFRQAGSFSASTSGLEYRIFIRSEAGNCFAPPTPRPGGLDALTPH